MDFVNLRGGPAWRDCPAMFLASAGSRGRKEDDMDRELYDKVSVWFEEHREQMMKDIIRLVRIPSVSEPGGDSQAPFGRPCRECLEEMLAIGREHGLHTENYGNQVGSIGEKEKNWENMIGFWNHMDVVPIGNQWQYEPFEPTVEEPFLIGRGSQDNKGPAVGILYMMECLRELKVPLKHQLCLFVGTDEERGMGDLEYYTSHYPVPRMSMVADSGFPVCYGEKGIVEGRMLGREAVSGTVLELAGGSAGNMIPDAAYAVLRRTEALEKAVADALSVEQGNRGENAGGASEEKGAGGEHTCGLSGGQNIRGENVGRSTGERETSEEHDHGALKVEVPAYPGIRVQIDENAIRIEAEGRSRHSAFPEGSVNAIHRLMAFLAELDALPPKDRELFGRLAFLSEEYYGEHPGIAYADEVSGRTTCAATVLGMREGRVSLQFNIRYAITAPQQELLQGLERAGKENGMIWELERNSGPNYFPREHPAVDRLTALYNEITGSRKESFVMGGGTYARKLPNAFAYGVGGMQESEEDKEVRRRLFLPGHGGAHEPDEGLNIRLLTEAMKIYAMAMVELNDCVI